MHRLTQLEQHVVGDVNDRIDGANPAATQLLFHPQRRWRFNIDTLHHAAQVARTGLRRFNGDRQSIGNGGGNGGNLRCVQRFFIQNGHVAGDADDT